MKHLLLNKETNIVFIDDIHAIPEELEDVTKILSPCVENCCKCQNDFALRTLCIAHGLNIYDCEVGR